MCHVESGNVAEAKVESEAQTEVYLREMGNK